MRIQSDLKDIAIGILTWRTPKTLRNTLDSYRSCGLFDLVGETILFANEAHPRDLDIAREFGLEIIASSENIGIGPAVSRMVDEASLPFFMLLENDWLCVELETTVESRLSTGLKILDSDIADVVRYRHRRNHGEPLHSKISFENNELPHGLDHLLDSIHWRENPETDFPDFINKHRIDDENWYIAKSRHANYTNNPCLYRRDFLKTNIVPHAFGDGISLEVDIHHWWKDQEFQVAQGEGIFEHKPLEKSGKGYNFLANIRGDLRQFIVG